MLSQFTKFKTVLNSLNNKQKFPTCKNCLFRKNDKCKLAIEDYDIKNGNIKYLSTHTMRNEPLLCGPEGKYFRYISNFERIQHYFEDIFKYFEDIFKYSEYNSITIIIHFVMLYITSIFIYCIILPVPLPLL